MNTTIKPIVAALGMVGLVSPAAVRPLGSRQITAISPELAAKLMRDRQAAIAGDMAAVGLITRRG